MGFEAGIKALKELGTKEAIRELEKYSDDGIHLKSTVINNIKRNYGDYFSKEYDAGKRFKIPFYFIDQSCLVEDDGVCRY